MASVSMGEREFELLANAANDALDRGDNDAAVALDKLARKVNAALSANSSTAVGARLISGLGSAKRVTWVDVPSTLNVRPEGGKP